jgi:primosomal protein N' (replication factor Y) (superfamily II helicase)
MFVIEVIPLVRGIQIESLSYFSGTPYSRGTIVQIPVRGKTVGGVVIESAPVSSAKTALKAATFSLRKLPPNERTTTLSHHLLLTVDELYKKLPAKRGAILFSLLPPDVRHGLASYPPLPCHTGDEDPAPQLLAAPKSERVIAYQSIIRTAFAHRGSVLLVVPTVTAVKYFYDALQSGITDRVVCFSSEQGKKSRTAAYEQFSDVSRASLIITTPHFAYLDRPDLTTIIVEEVGSNNYIERARPYLDHRQALITLARVAKRTIILGDIITRTDDEYKLRAERYLTYGEPQRRLTLPSTLTIVSQHDKPKGETPFSLFSPELKKRIETALEGRHNIFLYAARRGLAPVVACIDCGFIFRCPDSGTPYSLLRTHHPTRGEERWFLSTTSGKRVRASDVCEVCGSWRLRERGIGIQHIEDEVKSLFPQVPLVTFDATTATTHKKALGLRKIMDNHKGAIFLGTSMIMPYLPESIYLSAIVSLDAVRAIPTWRADESLFRLLLTLREHSSQEVMVQTRTEPDDLLLYAARGAIDRFHDDELALRKMLKYPPYARFYFLTWQGTQEHITETETHIQHALAPLPLATQYYTNPQSRTDKPMRHCLIRTLENNDDSPLIDILCHLPPHISITVNPDRIV